MKARALVVRSGAIPFSLGEETLRVELVEKVSHAIEPLLSGEEALASPAHLAIFTSQVAVRRLSEEVGLLGQLRQCVAAGSVVAVGAGTAEALRTLGIAPDIVAAGSTADVLDRLPRKLAGWRVILPRGEDASEELAEGLTGRGARVAPLVLYRKVANPPDPDLERDIREGAFGAFCPTSPSAARWVFASLGEPAMARLRRIPAAVLGRFTRRYLEAHGIERVEIAREASFAAAAELLERLAAGPRRA